ncbi:hypothetical protein PJ311_18145 [Bacillus sp. CLL-7-23]|uniref:Uncharacterized protein n=1 Tax=Bacillus changyiensis TaxID=3004103 RepID=A0ABT4XAU5_9BACI|nr:hypothetical protein [Bacillus changyiensis]MDA7028462.1 hypothetical protein [Bacillus changyiensis]
MAKLEIKLTEEARERKKENPESSVGLKFSDYDILIDGQEPTYLTNLNLSIGAESFNTATLTFFVDELDCDPEFLVAIEAKIKADTKSTGKKYCDTKPKSMKKKG